MHRHCAFVFWLESDMLWFPICREVVLDTLLQIGEALSLTDKYSAQLASNKELFGLAGKVIRLSGFLYIQKNIYISSKKGKTEGYIQWNLYPPP
jgi:hypothetical protein